MYEKIRCVWIHNVMRKNNEINHSVKKPSYLLKTKPFINLTNHFEKLIDIIDTVIKATQGGELDGLLSSIKRKPRTK